MQSLSSLTVPDPSSNLIPSHTQISYSVPPLPVLLSLSAYLYLLSATSTLADRATHAPLTGPLMTGVLLGPALAGLLSPSTQQAFISVGYIGLILIVFEAGLTTHIPLLISNIGVSTVAALTGVVLPIALSLALLHGAYGYTKLQSFAAGAALCSTSLGTTLALLTPRLRKTRVGSVLMCAALLDDVVGLVIAGIIANLADSEGVDRGVRWETVVRPVLVSIAFGVGSPALAWVVRWLIRFDFGHFSIFRYLGRRKRSETSRYRTYSFWIDTRTQLFLIVCTLSGFVAGSSYAGTSELFGAYLAGTFLAYIFGDPALAELTPSCSPSPPPVVELQGSQPQPIQVDKKNAVFAEPSVVSNPYIEAVGPETTESQPKEPTSTSSEENSSTLESFNKHIAPILTPLLGPIFFASVGAALPVGSLFTITTTRSKSGAGEQVKSHSVVWKGIVYALVMAFAKAAVGVWMVVCRDKSGGRVGGVADIQDSDDAGEGGRGERSAELWGLCVLWPLRRLKEIIIMVKEYALKRWWKMTSPEKQTEMESESEMGTRVSDGPVPRVNQFDLERGANGDGDVDVIAAASVSSIGSGSPESSSGQNPTPPGLASASSKSSNNNKTHILTKTTPHPTTPMNSSSSVTTSSLSPSPSPSPNVHPTTSTTTDEPSPVHAALLLGFAMIARGEIALIVAQLARPLLVQGSKGSTPYSQETGEEEEEPYAVVIWAIVLCTIGGALGVGWLLGRWEREEREKEKEDKERKEEEGSK